MVQWVKDMVLSSVVWVAALVQVQSLAWELPHAMGTAKGKKKKDKQEIMAKNTPNLGRDIDIQVHEAHRSPNKINLKRSFLRYIIKLSKIKERGES